jgi:hypothetical protein
VNREHPLNRDRLLECLRHCARLRVAQVLYAEERSEQMRRVCLNLAKIVDQQLESLKNAGLMNPELPFLPTEEQCP